MPYRTVNIYPVIPNGTGEWDTWVVIPPWKLPDGSGPFDVWITGWSIIIYPYPGFFPVNLRMMMLGVAEGIHGERPLYNFGSSTDTTFDKDLGQHGGIFLPANAAPPHVITLNGLVEPMRSAMPGFVPFTTLRYQLDSDF